MDSLKEKDIQKTILDWGGIRKIPMHRINVIGTPYKKNGLTYYRPAPNVGMADILCTPVIENIPVCVWLEVKTSKGRQSTNQRIFEENIKKIKGHYYIVKSIEDVERALKEVEIFTWESINNASEKKENGWFNR